MPGEDAPLIFAVDGGGSVCRARLLTRNGVVIGEARTGPANIATDFDASCENIHAAAAATSAEAESDAGSWRAYLALAGADDAVDIDRLRRRLGFATITLTSDIDAAVAGALRDLDGVLAGIGTGSFFVSRAKGTTRRVGGHGFALADDCSGAQLGREALRMTVRAHDGLKRHSALTRSVLARFDDRLSRLIAFSLRATPRDYGRFAPEVMAAHDAGDAVAREIVTLSVFQLRQILDALDVGEIGRLCLTGGLGHVYRRLLPETYQAFCVEPMGDGLDGVAALALRDQPDSG